jgi:hypothetical protein
MPKYKVKTLVEYTQVVEAVDEKQAEAMGWEYDREEHYDGVWSIDVDKVGE